jgi:hypothetical protein
MNSATMRRGARELLDDAIDRIRTDVFAVALLHVLPSVPFFAAILLWSVELDLRGAMPKDEALGVVLLLVPKLIGWSALSAWAAGAARGHPVSVGAAWVIVIRRFPEALLASSSALLLVMLAPLTAGISLLAAAGALVGLAAGVGPTQAGGLALLKQGAAASLRDFVRGVPFVILLSMALGFLVINLLALPYIAVQLGAGGLGLDLNLWVAALRPDRAAAWTFACMFAALVVETVLVVTCAEWQFDREAESEGTRFDAFADELDARRQTRTPVREPVA